MSDGRRFPIIDAVVEEAMAKAEAASDANHIRVNTKADRSGVILTTHCNGQDLAWITYDATQLEELIRQLQTYRADLR